MFRYGGADNDEAYAGLQTSDGGFVIGGIWTSYGNGGDFGIVKLNSSGNFSFGAVAGGSVEDRAYGIAEISSGYVLVGRTTDAGGYGSYDALVALFDNSGNLVWSRFVGTSLAQYVYWVWPDNDGNFIAGGYSYPNSSQYNVWFFKMTPSGNLVWSRQLQFSDNSTVREIRVDNSGKYIMVGRFQHSGGTDGLVVRTDTNGTPLFTLRIDVGTDDYIYSVDQTPSGDYCVAGYSTFSSSDHDILVLRVDTLGNLKWIKTIGGSNIDEGIGVAASHDDGCVITGLTFSYSHDLFGFEDAFVLKLDAGGNLVWARIIWSGSFGDGGRDIRRTSDNGFLITGSTYKLGAGWSTVADWFLVKTFADGTVCSSQFSDFSPSITTPTYTLTNPPATLINDNSTQAKNASLTSNTLTPDTTTFCTPLGGDYELSVEDVERLCVKGEILGVYSSDGRSYRSLEDAPRGVLFIRTRRGVLRVIKRR